MKNTTIPLTRIVLLMLTMIILAPYGLKGISMKSLEKKWNEKLKRLEKTDQGKYDGHEIAIDDVVRTLGNSDREKIEKEMLKDISNKNSISDFQLWLYYYFCYHYIKLGEKNKLIKLWSTFYHKPLYSDSWMHLIAQDKLDIFIVFFIVLERTKNPKIKEEIFQEFERAFPAIRHKFPDDSKFILEARNWFDANKKKLKVRSREEYGVKTVSMSRRQYLTIMRNKKLNKGLFYLHENDKIKTNKGMKNTGASGGNQVYSEKTQ